MHDIASLFAAEYGRQPRVFSAPGRVNWIGEHTDYNDGFVLPFAMDRRTHVAAAPREDGRLQVFSHGLGERAEAALTGPLDHRLPHWMEYVVGIARVLAARGHPVAGADLAVRTDVPIGAGLGSSAALEVAVGYALLALAGTSVPPLELALAAQAAEHEYAGTRCGIMDPYVAALGREGHALLIDCRSLGATSTPTELGSATVVVCNSWVRHDLAAATYNDRRAECEHGVALLARGDARVRALRDVSAEQLEARRAELPEVIYRRCRHVVHENERTLAVAAALRVGDLAEVGRFMVASHASLRDDYEVSAPELDLLVDTALAEPGVHGARLIGRGLGGCTVTLVDRDAAPGLTRALSAAFRGRYGRSPETFVTRAAGGVRED